MHSPLSILRQTPQLTPARFLAAHPGCWIQYYDDTEEKDPSKALSARSFDAKIARRKQQERCAVCFSLQAFGEARTKEGLLVYRNLGVDVDLVSPAQRRTVSPTDIDCRKEEYLSRYLLPFPLKPHWMIETRHGFHVIFRVLPQRQAEGIREAATLNSRLVSVLRGDENAALLTQVLRVPGTYQFKNPQRPFLCRVLLDNASAILPYNLAAVRGVLDTWEVFHGIAKSEVAGQRMQDIGNTKHSGNWPDGLNGAPEGQRNATAAAIVGGILGRLPLYLWETAAWGGLKEWNYRNSVPLSERELRSVFESIARREHAKRQGEHREPGTKPEGGLRVQIEIRINGRWVPEAGTQGREGKSSRSVSTPSPRHHAEQ